MKYVVEKVTRVKREVEAATPEAAVMQGFEFEGGELSVTVYEDRELVLSADTVKRENKK